jgi:hypothetical protein
MASVSHIQRASSPAVTAPMIGATQNSRSWPMCSPPANSAGPVLRAGLTEVLVTRIVGIEVLEGELRWSDPGCCRRFSVLL